MAIKKANTQNILILNTILSENRYFDINDLEIFDTKNYPNSIKWAIERIIAMFDDDYSFHLPSIDIARNSSKKQRGSRSYAMLKIICVMLKMMSLESMRIGRYNKANRWHDASIEQISKAAKVSISNTKKILIILSDAGIIKNNQEITSLDVKKGVFKVSIKAFTKNFFECLNLKAQRLKEVIFFKKERKEIKKLNEKLPKHLRNTETPHLKMVKVAEESRIEKLKKKIFT